MREIRFRAWCDKEKSFMFRMSLNEKGQSFDRDMALVYKPIIWNQYTGLKDKNGKEIYEGDIIKTGIDWAHGELMHRNGAFGFLDKYGADFNSLNYLSKSFHISDFEVIGNIYENPELLK